MRAHAQTAHVHAPQEVLFVIQVTCFWNEEVLFVFFVLLFSVNQQPARKLVLSLPLINLKCLMSV